MSTHTILLLHGEAPTAEQETILAAKGYVNSTTIWESANKDSQYNESKHFGTVAYLLATGQTPYIFCTESMLSKKGQLTLLGSLVRRMPKTKYSDFRLISVCLTTAAIESKVESAPSAPSAPSVQAPTNGSKESKGSKTSKEGISEWISKNSTCYTMTDLPAINLDAVGSPTEQSSLVRVTCGFETLHCLKGVEGEGVEGAATSTSSSATSTASSPDITGHSTMGYDLTLEAANSLKNKNLEFIGKVVPGTIISVCQKSNNEGSVVYLPTIPHPEGKYTHITVNTPIKAVLSGPIVKQFLDKNLEFNLSQIDDKTKTDSKLVLRELGLATVRITGWYCYCIENLN